MTVHTRANIADREAVRPSLIPHVFAHELTVAIIRNQENPGEYHAASIDREFRKLAEALGYAVTKEQAE